MTVRLGPGNQVEAQSTSTRCRESLGLTIGQIDAYQRMQRAIENGVMVGGEDEQDQVEQDQVEQYQVEQNQVEQYQVEQNQVEQVEVQNEEVGQDQFVQEHNENEEEQDDQVDQEQNENEEEQDDQVDQEPNENEEEQVEIRNMVEQVLDILVDEDEQRKRPAEEDVTVGVAKRIKLEANQEPVKPVIMNEVPIEIDSDEEDDGISEDEDGGAGEGEGTSEELMEAKRVYEELLMRSQKNNPKIELKREKMGLGEREGEVDAIRREREGKQASLAIYRQRMLKLTSPPVPIPVLEVPVVPLKPFFQSFLFNFHSYFSIFRLIMGPPKEPKHWLMGWHPRYIQHFSLNFVTLISYFQADNVPVGPLV